MAEASLCPSGVASPVRACVRVCQPAGTCVTFSPLLLSLKGCCLRSFRLGPPLEPVWRRTAPQAERRPKDSLFAADLSQSFAHPKPPLSRTAPQLSSRSPTLTHRRTLDPSCSRGHTYLILHMGGGRSAVNVHMRNSARELSLCPAMALSTGKGGLVWLPAGREAHRQTERRVGEVIADDSSQWACKWSG